MRALGASRTSLVPGGVLAGPWVRNDLWRKARAVPSLDLRFADNKSLTDAVTGASLVTFTRAGNGTYTDSAGVLQTAATDVPRFDHNPTTGESLGLLVEEQRTNSITNNAMVGAVAGTPGTNPTGWIYATASSNGLTLSIVGTGVENGINYIDFRFNGTTVASPLACAIGIVNATAATGQTWTASTYWKLAAGTATGITGWQIGIIESTAGGSFVTGAFYAQTAPTSAALITQRPAATRTLSGGATIGLVTYPINVSVAGNTAIDFTIRIGLPQLEQGAFATSPILTSTATVTRAADVASITGSNFSSWYNQTEGTVFADAKEYPFVSTISRSFYGFDNSASPNADFNRQWIWSGNTTLLNNSVYTSSSGPTAAEFSSTIINEQKRTALTYKVNDYARSYNGGAVVTDLSGNLPVGIDRLGIGSSNNAQHLSGTIKRLAYFPQRLPNSTLQALTQ